MVDCEVLTQFSKSIIIDSNRLLLQSKTTDYTIEIMFQTKQCKKIPKVDNSFLKKKTPIKAVYGIIQMEINSYLVAITKATVIGQIYHRKIFQIQKVQFFCLSNNMKKQDNVYISGLQEIFATKYFYFSDDYDLTNSLQEFIGVNCSMKNKKLQYMYNSDWIDQFLKIKAYQWITGFISGVISISFNHGVNHACQMALISRRDKRRQGMRWITRGSDLDGNTANTAQTQVVFSTTIDNKQYIFSHVQLRGSMPFLWKQFPDMKWSPKCKINQNDRLNSQLIAKNFSDIKKYYQNFTCINLIDKKGSQKMMGQYFQNLHGRLGDTDVNLIWFDFHSECKGMKYENLVKLIELVHKQLENYGYFHVEIQNSGINQSRLLSKKNSQKGIFRTNCMDNLDRTNVVQSVIARQVLLSWLYKLGFQNKPRNISAFERLFENLEQNFRSQWTKNADVLSILYSGTPAMKTDFTATGKRTKKGALMDGYYGVKRYFLGNFLDSRKQDFVDFSLNKIKPHANKAQKIRHSSLNSLYFLVLIIISLPFIVHYGTNSLFESNENNNKFYWKIFGTLFGALIIFKTAQMMNSMFVRKPIKNTL